MNGTRARTVTGDRGDQGQIVGLLARVAVQERAPRGLARHHILVVAEQSAVHATRDSTRTASA